MDEMKLLKFEKMNQLIVISAKGDNSIYQEKFKVKANNLTINFIEYVKSQLHSNVVTDFFGRNIFAYLNTYKFLKGEIFLEDEAIKVLNYFYEDIANFLIKNPLNMKLCVTLNPEGETDLKFLLGNISEYKDFSQVKNFLESLLNAKTDLELFQIIQSSEYSFILDYVLSMDDIKNKINSWILATAILSYLAQGVTMRKKVRKGCANVIANAVRQIALTSLDSLRPVAIRVGNHCDVISAGDSVLEDMVQIITNLNSLNFVSKSAGEIVEFRTVVKETLKASDLKGNSFEAVLPGEKDVEILHVLNDEIEVVVYFRNTCGVGTKDDNLYALAKAGVDTDKLVVVNSRHTDISKFAYTISEDTDELTDVIDFQIESKISNSLEFNEEILKSSAKIIRDILSEF